MVARALASASTQALLARVVRAGFGRSSLSTPARSFTFSSAAPVRTVDSTAAAPAAVLERAPVIRAAARQTFAPAAIRYRSALLLRRVVEAPAQPSTTTVTATEVMAVV